MTTQPQRLREIDKVYLKYGAELDHIFIARHKDSNFPNLSEDILSGGLGPSSCPPIAPPQQNYRGWIVVSSRPENHRDSIEHWLLMHNIALDKLLLRDDFNGLASRPVMAHTRRLKLQPNPGRSYQS